MLPSRFTKMSGGGNDFLVFEADGRQLSDDERRRLSLLCRRGLSVGADGALFLSGGNEGRIRLDYFNADGGLASFCANGTRCAARYAADRRLVAGNAPVLETGWAPIAAHVDGDSVALSLPPLPKPGDPVSIGVNGINGGNRGILPRTAIPMHVGVPHLVVFLEGDGQPGLDALDALDIARLGPPLRRHPSMPDGANVNFVRVESPDRIAVRTFERGVEGETLACGSGVVASAVAAARTGLARPPVRCSTRSGAIFTVDFTDDGGDVLSGVVLSGDAREIFTGEVTEEAWLQ